MPSFLYKGGGILISKGHYIYFAFVSFIAIYSSMINVETGLTALLIIILFLYKIKEYKMKRLAIIILVFIGFFLRGFMVSEDNHSIFTGKEKNFLIMIKEQPKIEGDLLTSFVVADTYMKEKLLLRYHISSKNESNLLKENLKIGMVCRMSGELKVPSGSRNENEFDYKKYLRHKQIYWVLKLDQMNLGECRTKKEDLTDFLEKIRYKGIEYISRYFPEDTAPLAVALIFGDRELIDEKTLQSYQKLGIIHLLAISGSNVAMIIGMLFYLGIRLGITVEKVNLGLIIVLPIYMVLTGATPSVNRACLMAIIILLMKKWRLQNHISTLDVISTVFSVYIFYSPHIVFDVGFQLSFCVCFGIMLSVPFILNNILHPISQLLAVSFIAQISATPIMLFHFFEVSLISILANIVFVPLFSIIILPLLLFIFIFHLMLGTLISPMFILSSFIIKISNNLTEIISAFPYLTIALGHPSVLHLTLYIFSVPFFFFLWEKKRNKLPIILLIPLLTFTFHYTSNKFNPNGEVTIIDVGQGDSILIRLPYNRGIYLIDTGGTLNFKTEEWKERKEKFEVGRDVLVPYLKSKGINSIDKLILTHGDMDHIGGSLALIQNIKIREILLPKTAKLSPLEYKIVKAAKNKDIKLKSVQAGQQWRKGENVFYVLSPKDENLDKNDGSIVIYTELGGLRWLFTGDLEEQGEESLVKRYPDLDVDVLKVGHHGSKSSTSDALLDTFKPRIGLISAGVKNRFGHPHLDVIKKLGERNITVIRTDQSGGITYNFRKNKGTFSTHIP